MKRIIVDVNSLKTKLLESEREGMEFIELCVVPSQMEDGILNPAFLHFEGISKSGMHKDYESIDEVPVTEHFLIDKTA